jgi:serine/threonine protein kinase
MTEASHKDIEKIAKPGQLLAGKYLVDRLLGVGGMGAVVSATHTHLDQLVAIKFLLPEMMGSEEVVARFLREARAAAKIKSEHVVRVSDTGTLDGGVPYIVMEFLEGHDLGELLERRGPLPVALAVDYVLEACEALAEAHAAGIVHRDLKPSNLFLSRRADDTEIVKVLDFGISKQISPEALTANPSLTKTTDVFGSPTYMSPEQLKASRDVDTRADVWALGVILYELLSGKTPFGGGTVAEIFGAILHQPAPGIRDIRKDVHVDLERALLRCLEKDVAKRFQTIAELADALVPFGSDSSRESTARVNRILRLGGPHGRASNPGSRNSSPSLELMRASSPEIIVPASTSMEPADRTKVSADAERPDKPGTATSTSWGHIKPAAKPTSTGRVALVAGGVLAAAVAGVLLALKLASPAAGPAGASGSTLPVSDTPTAPTSPATVVPAPSGDIAAPPPATASAPPTVAPAGSTAAPKLSGKLPTTAAPTPSTAPSTAPTAKPDTPKPPPTGGGDDDWGGRR